MKCLIISIVSLFSIVSSWDLYAQETQRDWGKLNGSLETNWGVYFKDDKLGIKDVEDKYGTNTYLTLGYAIKNFRFGLEYDLYKPPMVGFSPELEGCKLMRGFAAWSGRKLELRAGTVYEQFGSGLVLRIYEDRALGFNNALMGGNVRWRPWGWLTLKAVAGVPQKFQKYAPTRVYGADGELDLGGILFPESDMFLSLGGSWVMRDDQSDERYEGADRQVNNYAGRLEWGKGIFSFGGEYVSKSNSLYWNVDKRSSLGRGQMVLMHLGIDAPGIGFSAEFRAFENGDLRIDDNLGAESVSLNYVPALTLQHKYSLLSLFPHKVEMAGETGGQFSLYGELPLWGEKRNPLLFTVNGSMYRELTLKADGECESLFKQKGDLLYSEVGLELEQKWSKHFKSNLLFYHQKKAEFSKYGFGNMEMASEVLVADVLYKVTSKTSLRMELQHVWSNSKDDQRWVMGLLELGLAPRWMVYVSDMCNYKSYGESLHYYRTGCSYSWRNLRASVDYGRNRAGMQCSGGVCRYVPEHTGLSIMFSIAI
ncbi:MAG: DUF6029 family protein [Odoribacter sp.]|nr:DUF6029 family protein [Odoribacter sp.]MDY3032648.1 DUF6029 family protein [Odoribacter sp.]